jgi:hypothetical protein
VALAVKHAHRKVGPTEVNHRVSLGYRRGVPEQHRALDWLARRHSGESAALIAHLAGVSEKTVLRATRTYGPFPRPSRQLGRYQLGDDALGARARRWVELRLKGHTTTAIAAAEGVVHRYVSKATRDHGPYPAADVIAGWVDSRHRGRTLAAIAGEAGVPGGDSPTRDGSIRPFRPPGRAHLRGWRRWGRSPDGWASQVRRYSSVDGAGGSRRLTSLRERVAWCGCGQISTGGSSRQTTLHHAHSARPGLFRFHGTLLLLTVPSSDMRQSRLTDEDDDCGPNEDPFPIRARSETHRAEPRHGRPFKPGIAHH